MEVDKEKIVIREIKPDTHEYIKELELRDEVLRKPLGRSLYNEDLAGERHDFHIGAFADSRLVGVMILTELSDTDVKMRQVAVDSEWRSRHIGREMVSYAEEYAKGKGYRHMLLNARKTAVVFYTKLGYHTVGDEFVEVGIPHYKMQKLL